MIVSAREISFAIVIRLFYSVFFLIFLTLQIIYLIDVFRKLIYAQEKILSYRYDSTNSSRERVKMIDTLIALQENIKRVSRILGKIRQIAETK